MEVLIGIGVLIIWLILFISMVFRKVVPTNEMHIVQRANSTTTYGKDQQGGNSYFNWYSWLPIIGIKRIILPATIFDITIDNYEAFDNGRVPFKVNVKGFFRIENFNLAAERLESMNELKEQLTAIVSSAIRVVLANKEINDILAERSSLGKEFMDAIIDDLKDFGVTCTKNIELMDITDSENSKIIYNIQKKKESEIERDARLAIALNEKEAKTKEIEANKAIEIAEAMKKQEVGKQNVAAEKNVKMEEEKANQEINEQKQITIEKEMSVLKTSEIEKAKIEKEKAEIEKAKEKEVKKLEAEAEAEAIKALAKGRQEAAENDANAIIKKWEAEAKAKQVVLEAEAVGELKKKEASVADQVKLYEVVSTNKEYIDFLLGIKAIEQHYEAEKIKGEALKWADIKYLAVWGENKYGEVLGKLWLGLETFKELGWNGNIKNLISNIVDTVKGNPSKENVKTKEVSESWEETEIINLDTTTKSNEKTQ